MTASYGHMTLVEELRHQAIYSSDALCGSAAATIELLEAELAEMRRTFGSSPLFAEKDAEIAMLRTAIENFADPANWHEGRGFILWAGRRNPMDFAKAVLKKGKGGE